MRFMAAAEELCAIGSYHGAAARHGVSGLEALTSDFHGQLWISETG
jgi:hypothetical protein